MSVDQPYDFVHVLADRVGGWGIWWELFPQRLRRRQDAAVLIEPPVLLVDPVFHSEASPVHINRLMLFSHWAIRHLSIFDELCLKDEQKIHVFNSKKKRSIT